MKYKVCKCGLEVERKYLGYIPYYWQFSSRTNKWIKQHYYGPVTPCAPYGKETYDKIGNVICPKCGEIIGECDWYGL